MQSKNKKENGFEGNVNPYTNALLSKLPLTIYKPFGRKNKVQSWIGGIGKLACLKNRSAHQRSAGSNFLPSAEVPHPAHIYS